MQELQWSLVNILFSAPSRSTIYHIPARYPRKRYSKLITVPAGTATVIMDGRGGRGYYAGRIPGFGTSMLPGTLAGGYSLGQWGGWDLGYGWGYPGYYYPQNQRHHHAYHYPDNVSVVSSHISSSLSNASEADVAQFNRDYRAAGGFDRY